MNTIATIAKKLSLGSGKGQATFEVLVSGLGELGLRYAGNLLQYCAGDGRVVFVDALFVRD